MATLNNQRVNLVETSLYLTQKDVVWMEKNIHLYLVITYDQFL